MVDNAPFLSHHHAGLTVEGYSRAAVQSYWRIPELKIGFDLGAHPWDFMGTPTWLITHTHLDHVAALPVYVARRRMMKMEPPTLYLPVEAIEDVRRLLLVMQRLDRGRMVCQLNGVSPGQEFAQQIGGTHGEFVLVGDFEPEAVVKQIEALVANWKAKAPYERIAQTAKTDIAGSKEDILTPDKEGATYVAAHLLAMKEDHQDFPALTMGNYLLGGSTTSRLFDRLRQKDGLSYGAGSQISADAQDEYAMFMMYAICNPQNLEKADKAAMEELQKVLKKGVSQEEFSAGLRAYLQELKLGFASDSRLSGMMQEDVYLGRTFRYHADWEKKITSLNVEGINKAMSAHVAPQRILIVRAGDLEKAKQK